VLADGIRGSKGQRRQQRRDRQSLALPWVANTGIAVEGLDKGRSNEDDFDAFMTAVALLRQVVEERPLAGDVDSTAEGAILGT